MKVELIGLSQGISFENKKATNYLDFRKETGELFRLAVETRTAEELLAIILKEEPAKTPPPPASREPLEIDREEFLRPEAGVTHGGTEFGGDDTSDGAEEDGERGWQVEEPFPQDESSVPSL